MGLPVLVFFCGRRSIPQPDLALDPNVLYANYRSYLKSARILGHLVATQNWETLVDLSVLNKMIRIVGCTIGLFLFGVIYGETINALDFFEFQVNVYLFAISIAFSFSVLDMIFNFYEKRASLSSKDEIVFGKLKRYYYTFFLFLGLVILIAVPFVWWGVIKKLAMQSK